MSLKWTAVKDPDEIKDYGLGWSAMMLPADVLASSVWSIVSFLPAGVSTLIIGVTAFDGPTARTTVWFSGGTDGQSYVLLNRVTTTGGRTYDQQIGLKIKTK